MPLQIAHLRAQHDQILLTAARLEALVAQRNLAIESDEIRHALSVLASQLRLHLQAEDQRLYPAMRASNDPPVRQTAERLQEEMGGLLVAFNAYHAQWTSEAIRRSGPDFSAATSAVIGALRRRVAQENETLYPLAAGISVSAAAAARTQRAGPPLIVVVDDNEADFLLFSEAWREAGSTVTFAYFALADQLLTRVPTLAVPDLVIIDRNLPRMGGLELIDVVRHLPGYAQVPIVLCSSMDGAREVALAGGPGAVSFFPKPTTFDEYLSFVQAMNDLIAYHRAP